MLKERGRLTMETLAKAEAKGWKIADPLHPTEREVNRIQSAIDGATVRARAPYRLQAKAGAETPEE